MEITKTQFQTIIDSFKKQPGMYTEEEQLIICSAHKKLPQHDKSWEAVAKVIGWAGSAESLRHWTKRRSSNIQTDIAVTDVLNTDNASDYIKQTADLLKLKQQGRDNWMTYNRMIREDARIDSFKEDLISAIIPIKQEPTKFVFKESVTAKDNNNEAVLLLSDLHIGTVADNFYNKYNKDVAEVRLQKLANEVIEYCQLNKVKQLNVLNLGDLISGLIHTSIRLEQEMDVAQQIIVASELVATFLNNVKGACPSIVYRSVTDNHSRAIANKKEAIEKENFYQIIDWYLQTRCKDIKNLTFENDNIDISIGKFALNNGKKVMFAHGHLDKPSSVFKNFIGITQEFIDYIFLGHYHNPQTSTVQNCRVFINGSMCGTESFALSQRYFTEPTQKLIIFNKDNVLDIDIVLDKVGK